MKAVDPFSGVKLSEAMGRQGLDQQLFTSTPPVSSPPVLAPSAPGAEQPTEVARPKPPPQPARKAPVEKKPASPPAPVLPALDINLAPWHKDSFLLTDEEFERIHDLKLTLRRRYDLSVTKNDITRAALIHICEDFQRDPEKSVILRVMRKKHEK